jgi:hypothetical protein
MCILDGRYSNDCRGNHLRSYGNNSGERGWWLGSPDWGDGGKIRVHRNREKVIFCIYVDIKLIKKIW